MLVIASRSLAARSGSTSRSFGPTLALAGLCLAIGLTAARADCQTDVGAIMKKRESAVALVNSSKAKNGKLDPVLACPRLRTLSAVEKEAVAYFDKNKDWCNLPSDLVDKMTASSQRTAQFAVQACNFAVKAKQMQQQQAEQQQAATPKLPTGPL